MLQLDNAAIVARSISKSYRTPIVSRSGFSLFSRSSKVSVDALKSTSFVVNKGEAVGVLGHNGSGKSTMLRILAGNEKPDTGNVHAIGTPSLLGVSAALQTQLSGVQNIRLGLLAMGLPHEQVEELIPEVAEISALEDALQRPMNTYSSGMQARLTFAIATSLRPDILMIDEALGTGDATFAEVAKKRMDDLLSAASTVFVVSHSAATLRKTCKRALWLHNGQIVSDGDLQDISREYAIWGEHKTFGRSEEAEEVVRKNLEQYTPPKIILGSEANSLLGRKLISNELSNSGQ